METSPESIRNLLRSVPAAVRVLDGLEELPPSGPMPIYVGNGLPNGTPEINKTESKTKPKS